MGTRVEIYDTTTGQASAQTQNARIGGERFFVFSPDADRLAEVASRVITIWDVQTGKKLVAFPESGNSIMSIAFSPDGTRLVSASSEGEVWLWDAKLESH